MGRSQLNGSADALILLGKVAAQLDIVADDVATTKGNVAAIMGKQEEHDRRLTGVELRRKPRIPRRLLFKVLAGAVPLVGALCQRVDWDAVASGFRGLMP
jgi:hypothetical protein